MYLFFDTETNGLPLDYKAVASDLNNWPRIVTISFLLHDLDGQEMHRGNFLIRPDGWEISDAVSLIHGINTRHALEHGVEIDEALGEFFGCLKLCTHLIGHNINFDSKIVTAEYIRSGCPFTEKTIQHKTHICTMLRTVNFCKLPGKYGYKWPRLQELHKILFGDEFQGAHNSMSDVEATAKCFWELKKRGVI